MQSIGPEQLQSRMESEDIPVLLDVRELWEFETCSISGSINLPMSILEPMLETLDKDKETVVICHHGTRSYQVGSYMQDIGFTRIINLEGGIDLWARTVQPEMKQY
jgi:rhodanese-related sulfurtransferase